VGKLEVIKGKAGYRIKIYLVVGLAMVLAALVYRHFKAKPSGSASLSPPSVTTKLAEVADLAPLDMASLQKTQSPKPKIKEARRIFLRDIFAPMGPLRKAEHRITSKGEPRVYKAPSLKLKGVIVGGRNSVAIINGKLVRLGERIDGYQLVRIEAKEVFLKSGNKTFKLELAQND
jgi:hypothetical protein